MTFFRHAAGRSGRAPSAHRLLKNVLRPAVLALEGRALLSTTAGTLDAGFGSGGVAVTGVRGSAFDNAGAVAVVPGNKVVAAGSTTVGSFKSVVSVVRYNSDGSLDRSFGNGGRVLTDPIPFAFSEQCSVVSVNALPGGKVLVGGWVYDGDNGSSAYSTLLLRYNSNGSLDRSFGNGGFVTSTAFGVPAGVVPQPNGQVLVAGTGTAADGNSAFQVVRFNKDGSQDATFAQNGVASAEIVGPNGAPVSAVASAFAVLSNGDLVVAGTSVDPSTSFGTYQLAAFDDEGRVDRTFGSGGLASFTPPTLAGQGNGNDGNGNPDRLSAVAAGPDGSVVVAGTIYAPNDPDYAHGGYGVVQFTPRGRVDTTFGQGGLAVVPSTAFFEQAPSLGVRPNGSVVVAGATINNFANGENFLVARLTPDGTPDRSFGGSGVVTTDFAHDGDFASAVAVQPDGRVVAAGKAYQVSAVTGLKTSDYAVARYNADGSLDRSFGKAGKATTDFFGFSNDAADAVVVQPDGHVVVAGTSDYYDPYSNTSGQSVDLVRYNTDGSVDTTFGTNGRLFLNFPSAIVSVSSLLQQADGKLVVVGTVSPFDGPSQILAARASAAGVPDASYGSGGTSLLTFGTAGDVTAPSLAVHGAALQPDGKVVVVGEATSYDASGNFSDGFGVVRLDASGNYDNSFGGGGQVTTAFPGQSAAYGVAVVKANGDLVVAGSDAQSGFLGGGSDAVALARYLPNGALDTTFGGGGEVVSAPGGSASSDAVAVAMQGNQIVVAGTTVGADGLNDFALARFRADGSADTTFGAGGVGLADFNGGNNTAAALAVAPDGKFVVVGTTFPADGSPREFAVARFTASGVLDTGFGTGGLVTTAIDQDATASGVAVQADLSVVVVGTTDNGLDGEDFAVVRYLGKSR